jgi:hypothetical protein
MSTVTQNHGNGFTFMLPASLVKGTYSGWRLIILKPEHVESCPVLVIFAYQAQGRIFVTFEIIR